MLPGIINVLALSLAELLFEHMIESSGSPKKTLDQNLPSSQALLPSLNTDNLTKVKQTS